MSIIKSTQKKVEKGAKSLGQAMELKSYRKLAINFLILTVNLIIIILYFTLSEAKITIVPKREDITNNLRLELKSGGGNVEQTTTRVSADFTPTGEETAPTPANGKITIHNTTESRNQTLVANTQFQNETGTIIRTKKLTELAPGQTVTVEAYADQPGKDGEVEPGRFQIVKLPAFRDKIYGKVEAKFTGGMSQIKILTQADYDQALAAMQEKLKTQAAAKLGEGSFALKITKLEATAKPGDKNINTYTIKAEATAKKVTFNQEQVRALALADLTQKLPPNKTIGGVDEDSFAAVPDETATYLDTALKAWIQPKFPDAVFNKKAIAGKNKDEVRKYFTKITGIKNIEVNFSPFWVRTVPRLEDHVDIEIKK